MDHLTEVWTKTRENIRPQMTGLSFHAWIDVIVPLVIKNGILVLEIPTRDILKTLSDFYFDYLVDAAKRRIPQSRTFCSCCRRITTNMSRPRTASRSTSMR